MGQASRHERAGSKLREKLKEKEESLLEELEEVKRRLEVIEELDELAEAEKPERPPAEGAPPT